MHRAIKRLNATGSRQGFPVFAGRDGSSSASTRRCTERRADEATRDVAERLKCLYLKDHVGETFDAIVASVAAVRPVRAAAAAASRRPGARHGAAAPTTTIRDPTGTMLTGERTGNDLSAHDPMRVRLVAVNVEERKIDLVPEAQSGQRGGTAAPRHGVSGVAERGRHRVYGLHAVRALLRAVPRRFDARRCWPMRADRAREARARSASSARSHHPRQTSRSRSLAAARAASGRRAWSSRGRVRWAMARFDEPARRSAAARLRCSCSMA